MTCFWKQNDKTGATLTRLIKWKSHQFYLFWIVEYVQECACPIAIPVASYMC